MTTETTTTDERTPAPSMMAAPVAAGPAPAPVTSDIHPDAEPDAARRPRIVGLRCRSCFRAEDVGPSYVCPACFGPLEVV